MAKPRIEREISPRKEKENQKMRSKREKTGFRSAGKRRYDKKLSQHNKKSGLRTIRRDSSTGTSIHTFSTKRSNKPGRSTLYGS